MDKASTFSRALVLYTGAPKKAFLEAASSCFLTKTLFSPRSLFKSSPGFHTSWICRVSRRSFRLPCTACNVKFVFPQDNISVQMTNTCKTCTWVHCQPNEEVGSTMCRMPTSCSPLPYPLESPIILCIRNTFPIKNQCPRGSIHFYRPAF